MYSWEPPLEKEMETTPGFLPGEPHGRRRLVGYSPWGPKQSGTRKDWACTHTCIPVLLSHEFVSDSLWPHGPQHASPPCPSLFPEVCSNSCLLSGWRHPTISSSVIPLLFLLSIFPRIRVFSNVLALCIRWHWSFSISSSSDYSGLISISMDWFALVCTHLCGPFGEWWLKKLFIALTTSLLFYKSLVIVIINLFVDLFFKKNYCKMFALQLCKVVLAYDIRYLIIPDVVQNQCKPPWKFYTPLIYRYYFAGILHSKKFLQ